MEVLLLLYFLCCIVCISSKRRPYISVFVGDLSINLCYFTAQLLYSLFQKNLDDSKNYITIKPIHIYLKSVESVEKCDSQGGLAQTFLTIVTYVNVSCTLRGSAAMPLTRVVGTAQCQTNISALRLRHNFFLC